MPLFGDTDPLQPLNLSALQGIPGYGTAGTTPQRNLFAAGLSSGIDQLQALGGSALQAVGRGLDFRALEDLGAGIAKRNYAEAQANGRADLEVAPWDEGGASVLPWLAYQTTKQLPQIAALIAAGRFVPKSATSEALASAGARVPQALGGGRGLAAAEAATAGQEWARAVTGATIAGYPMGVGSLYKEAVDEAEKRGERPTKSTAFAAMAGGLPYAALDALEPAQLKGLISRGMAGRLGRRVGTAALAGAATEMPQEAAQTAMEMAFRPDLPVRDKMKQIIDAALTGGAVGGVLGGLGGVRKLRTADPNAVTNDDIASSVDENLQPGGALPSPAIYQPGGASAPIQTLEDETGQLRPASFEPGEPIDTRAMNQLTRSNTREPPQPAAPRLPDEQPTVLASQSADFLQRAEGLLLRQRETGNFTQRDAELLRETQAEIARRGEQQPSLLQADQAPVQLSPTAPKEAVEMQKRLERDARGDTPQVLAVRKQMREHIGGKNRIADRMRADDEVDVVNQLTAQLDSRATWSDDFVAAAKAYGLIDDKGNRLNLDRAIAETTAKIDQLQARAQKSGSPGLLKQAKDLQGTLTTLEKNRTLQREAEARNAAPEAPEGVAPAEVKPAEPTYIPPSTPAQRQAAFDAAQGSGSQLQLEMASLLKDRAYDQALAQKQVQDTNSFNSAFSAATAQLASEAPVRIAPQDVSTGTNARLDADRRKTVAAFNALTGEQQARILDSEDFKGGKTPEANLIDYITSSPNQATARNQLARLAGVDPAVLAQAQPATAAYVDPADMTPVQRMARTMQTISNDRKGNIPDTIRRSAGFALAEVRNGSPTAEQSMRNVLDRYERFKSGETVFAAGREGSQLTTGQALDPVAFEQAFDRVTRKLGIAGSRINVVDDYRGLPAEVQETIADRGHAETAVKGVMHNGDIYVVRSAMRSEADLQEVIMHELFGHVGARALFGKDVHDVMGQLYDASGGITGVQMLARRLGIANDLNEYIPPGKKTREDEIRIFDELLALAAGRPLGKMKQLFAQWGAKLRDGMIKVLRRLNMNAAADNLSKTSVGDVVSLLHNMRTAARLEEARANGDTNFMVDTRSVAGAQEGVARIKDAAVGKLEALKRAVSDGTVRENARKAVLYFSSINHMVADNAKLFPQLKAYADAQQHRQTVSARWANLFDTAWSGYEKMAPKMQELTGKLMRYTEPRIDPGKSWDEHTWLHSSNPKDAKRQATMRKLVADANAEFTQLVRAGQKGTYDNMKAVNNALNYAHMATSLHNMVANDPALASRIANANVDPMDAYIQTEAVYSSPQRAAEFWKAALDAKVNAIETFIDRTNGARTTDVENAVNPLVTRLRSIKASQTMMDQAPYFHMGRTGEYFVAFTVANDGKGNARGAPTEGTMDAVAKRLEDAGFSHAQVSNFTDRSSVYIRVKTPEQVATLRAVADQMRADGMLDKRFDTLSGKRSDQQADEYQTDPQWLDHYIQNLRATYDNEVLKGMSESEREQAKEMVNNMVSSARELWLNSLPDTAIAKVLTRRDAIPGYDKDMVTSFAHRMRVGVGSLAGLSGAAKTHKALADMRGAINAKKRTSAVKDTLKMQDIFNEVMTRETQHVYRPEADWIDQWRAINHAYFLGASPSYVAVNMTQLGVLLWPELAKTTGFVGAAKAIARATPTAFKVMAATVQTAKQRGWRNMADATITGEAMRKAGVSEADAKFIMSVVNTGNIDIGSFSRELARVAENKQGTALDTTLRFAASAGYYSETLTRLIAALAARDTYNAKPNGKGSLSEYVNNTINESMLQYSSWNTARATGRMGLAGRFSQVMASFMTYTMQVTEKLYREMYVAFRSKAHTEAEKQAAKRFLGSHLAAVTALSGTLGMPTATAFAGVADLIGGLLGDDGQPYDVKAQYRRFLADMFGKDVGEVLARGLPRAIGIDVSQRAGEQDLIPFSRMLADKRKFEDSWKDQATQVLGSPVSMVFNIMLGMTEIGKGNVLEGMAKMVPMAVRGPTLAYQMSTKGYTDAKGNKLPMTVGASDILAQALGFTPAEKAEYSEERRTYQAFKGQLVSEASNIRKNLAEALEAGNMNDARDWLAKAQSFDKRNPAYAIMPGIGSTLARRAQERAQAAALNTPLGVNIRDLAGRGLLGFGNYSPQQ